MPQVSITGMQPTPGSSPAPDTRCCGRRRRAIRCRSLSERRGSKVASVRRPRSPTTDSASPTRHLADPTRRAGRWTRARELFAEYRPPHPGRVYLLDELRDVALTYDAADPAARRRLAAEAEAALGRAGGALRPGVSPRLAWLGCLVLDGRWDEAFADPATICQRLATRTSGGRSPARGAVLARHRGDPESAWEQIRPLFPDGPGDRARRPHPPGRASSCSASRPTSASTRVTCRQRRAWLRRTTAGSPGAGACSAAPTGRSPGRATTGRPATLARARAAATEAIWRSPASPDQPLRLPGRPPSPRRDRDRGQAISWRPRRI